MSFLGEEVFPFELKERIMKYVYSCKKTSWKEIHFRIRWEPPRPLKFPLGNDINLSLPLFLLPISDVKIILKFNNIDHFLNSSFSKMKSKEECV